MRLFMYHDILFLLMLNVSNLLDQWALILLFILSPQIADIHPENYRLLKTDLSTYYAVSPTVISEAIVQDKSSGLIPLFPFATVR